MSIDVNRAATGLALKHRGLIINIAQHHLTVTVKDNCIELDIDLFNDKLSHFYG